MPTGNWKPGEAVKHPVDDMVQLDLSKLDVTSRYKLLIGGIVPRPIALVSTISSDGVPNLAPFSFFNGVCSEPPCLVFSASYKPDGSEKDTMANIKQTKEFVVHTVSEWFVEPMNQTSAAYPAEVNEIEKVGLTAIPAVCVKPLRIKESPVHFECRLEKLVQVGEVESGAATLVIGRILMAHVYSDAYQNGRILHEKLKPIARMGGLAYAEINETFELNRPRVEPDNAARR